MTLEESTGVSRSGDEAGDPWEQVWMRLEEAIVTDDEAALRQIIAEKRDLIKYHFLRAFLTEAAELDCSWAVAALLEVCTPSDIEILNENGCDPLLTAASKGNLETALILLEAGADPNAAIEEDGSYGNPQASGRCALASALYNGHQGLIELLEPITSPEMRARAHEAAERRRAWAADPSQFSEATGRLFLAIQEGRLDQLQEAITVGADIHYMLSPASSNPDLGSTPLSFAAAQGRIDLVETLLQAGAAPGLRDRFGRTAADFAAFNGHDEVAARLRAMPRPSEGDGG